MTTELRKLLCFLAAILAVLQGIFFLLTLLCGSSIHWYLFLPTVIASLAAIAGLYAENHARRRSYFAYASIIIMLIFFLETAVAVKMLTILPIVR